MDMTTSLSGKRFWNVADYPPATAFHLPERDDEKSGFLEKMLDATGNGIFRRLRQWSAGGETIVSLCAKVADELARLDDKGLQAAVSGLRDVFNRQGFHVETVGRAFALIREVADRTLGLRHFDVQIKGAWAILNGMIAEMETGEGKTLTATLAAGTAALAGIPVHVISVNDYLTRRDADSMAPVYAALGLRVGCVVQDSTPAEKRNAYRCDITYATNKIIVFDYLRDRIALRNLAKPLLLHADALCRGQSGTSGLLQRGLFFAIVDEADSVLVDEARTPLIISGASGNAEENLFLQQAVEIADALENGVDYTIDFVKRVIRLSEKGKSTVQRQTGSLGPLWKGTVRREDIVEKALTARFLFIKDEHYIVNAGKVQIVDEFTGRVMPDRSWEHGLHQLIEIREGCEVSGRRETMARISYQNYFRRYFRLGGMTGTAKEIQRELHTTYGLAVRRIPTNRPVIRKWGEDRIFRSVDEKWNAVVSYIQQLHEQGKPVLVGTRSVAASEHLSRLLTLKTDIPHNVLNAWKIAEEAEIVAQAGRPGAVTIATNMAGRGTDIKLGQGVREKGGLHVILTERHEASRIDRQLAGRCGRQGDPGRFEAFLSIEDPIVFHERSLLKGLAFLVARFQLPGWQSIGKHAIADAQKKIEFRHHRIRKQLFKMDEKTQDMLVFSGRSE